MKNQFTVTVIFQDGFTCCRDLLDQYELKKYIANGVAMHLVLSINILNNFES